VKGGSGEAEYVMVCVGYEILMALKIQVWSWVITLCTLASVHIIDCVQGRGCEGMQDVSWTGLDFPLSVILKRPTYSCLFWGFISFLSKPFEASSLFQQWQF
jgi:hypothetical protein